MGMPIARFFAYARCMDQLDAAEQSERIEASSMPYMEKRDRSKVVGALRRRLSPRRKGKADKGVVRQEFIGGLPADVARLKMLERESPLLRGLIEIRHKKPQDEVATASLGDA